MINNKVEKILYSDKTDLGVRLETGLKLCPKCDVVADIGSDHGKLSVALLLNKKCNYIIASDISAPCLSKTRKIARRYGLEDKVELRIGNGFEPYFNNEIDVAAISGMGGELIAKILQEGENKAESCKAVLLQPMQSASKLRAFLRSNNWRIIDEIIVNEKKRLFEWIKVKRAEPQDYPKGYDLPNNEINVFDEIGPLNFKRRDPMAIMRFGYRVKRWEREYNNVRKSTADVHVKKTVELKKRLSDAQKLLRIFEKEGRLVENGSENLL